MTRTLASLYLSLQAGILACREHLPGNQIEASFQTAEHYCKKLFLLAENGFADVDEEINCFRNVKPLFIAELLYWQLVNHYFVFTNPANAPFSELVCREKNRLREFLLQHAGFHKYYTSGNRELDKRYFTRTNQPLHPPLPLYYGGPQPVSRYDWLVGSLLALQKYDRFIDEQLMAVQN